VSEHDELLERFKPQLKYDSNEAFFADSAAEWTDNPANELRRAPQGGKAGELLASATAAAGQVQLDLEFLAASQYADGESVERDDVIGCTRRDYRAQYVKLRQDRRYANRIYGHAKEDRGRLWLQYWFFYFYNDYNLAGGVGLHEGDWEMVQFRLNGDRDLPDLAVYAQHRWAEVAHWDEVEKLDGSPDTPVVYVARGSHASYFHAGYHETEAWYDLADGKRATPEMTLEMVGDDEPSWVAWPGVWGDTRPRIRGMDQPSPTAPCRHGQWDHPAVLMEEAKTISHDPAAPAPQVTVSRAADHLRLVYDFTDPGRPRPANLVVTVNSEDDPLPPRTFTYAVDKDEGTIDTDVELKPDQRYDIYVSAVDAEGKPTQSRLTLIPAVGESGPHQVPIVSTIGQVVAWVRGLFGHGR
jgi:hypothetical protein